MITKRLHWKDEANENRAHLSAFAMLRMFECFSLLNEKLDKEEIDSALWGLFEEEKHKIMPYILRFEVQMANMMIKIIKAKVKSDD